MERDEGRILTDEQLIELEKEIRRAYAAASVELMETIDAHFARFEKKDTEMRRLMEAGQITEDQYLQWRLSYIGRGKRFEELRDKLAERVTRANELAVSYVNNRTPTIYTLNRNYAGYSVDRGSRWRYDSFTLLDEATVRRLIRDKPDLMPNYPAKRALARGIDLAYGKKQITAAVTSGILQGKGVRKIAADLRERIVSMNVESAIRTARTAVTSAENGGRQDTFEAAAEAGIKVRRRWLATLDSRTRPEHGHADGQERGVDEPFIVGGEKLMFPGDKSHGASGWNIYNCRCCLTSATDKRFEKNPMKRRARNPETGEWELIPDMTFDEWQEWKRERAQAAAAKDDAATLDFLGADARDDLKKIVTRSTIKLENGFAAFPETDRLSKDVQMVKPLKTYFDVALHGSPSAVGFGTKKTNMSPRLLASVIRHSEGWNGQKIRLLSCSTGAVNGDEYCFAEELANALGVEVKAPNDLLYITEKGSMMVGKNGDGKFVTYKPNQRGRRK